MCCKNANLNCYFRNKLKSTTVVNSQRNSWSYALQEDEHLVGHMRMIVLTAFPRSGIYYYFFSLSILILSFQEPDNLFTSQWRKLDVPMRVVVVVRKVYENYESQETSGGLNMNLHSRLISYEKINCVFWYILNDVILKLTADSRVLFQSKQISADDSEMYSIKRHWQTDNCERDLEQIKMVFLSSESIWTKPILSKKGFQLSTSPSAFL